MLGILYKVKEVERKTSELYEKISIRLAHIDSRLANLFSELASDERIHEKQVDIVINLYNEDNDAVKLKDGVLQLIISTMELVSEKETYFLKNYQTMGLSDIIRIAEEIELEMEERHQNIYYTVNHPELKKLFSFLIKADGEHIAKLKTYLTN